MGTGLWIAACLASAAAGAAAGAVWVRLRPRRPRGELARLIRRHFHPVPVENLMVSQRQFPFRIRPDLQRALDAVVTEVVRRTAIPRYARSGRTTL